MDEKQTQSDQPSEGAGTTGGKKKDLRGWIIALLILLVLLMAGALIWFVTRPDTGDDYNDEDFFDPFAVSGILPDMSPEEIQAELNRVIGEGMFHIVINTDYYSF